MPTIELRTHQKIKLQDLLQVPRDNRGRVKWTQFQDDPSKLTLVVETMAQRILWQNHPLTKKTINSAGEPGLATGINLFYPGSLGKLREKLGLEGYKKPNGYWTEARVEAEVLRFSKEWGKVTEPMLRQEQNHSLLRAIAKYPGKMAGVKRKLQMELERRPNGEWTVGYIEQQAREFIEAGNELAQQALNKAGKSDLAGAIATHYPGKLTELKRNLGLAVREQRTITVEEIKEKASIFLERYGVLNSTRLRAKESGLLSAIQRRYPGGLSQLKRDVWFCSLIKPAGYWNNQENIINEAKKHLLVSGHLTFQSLNKNKLSSLGAAIQNKYPGGMAALKEKLGLISSSAISSEQANTDLDSLFEGGVK